MPHDPIRVADTRAWLAKAHMDLKAAAHEMTAVPPFTADVLFHAQQAAEKAMKGFLAWHDAPFRKTHDLAEIGRQCAGIDPSLESLLIRAASLTRYAWKFRYPAYYDDRLTDRRRDTEDLWARLDRFEVGTSELTRQELSQTTESSRRQDLLRLLAAVTVHPITEGMNVLADEYVSATVFSPLMRADAVHVAAAVVTRHDVLLSWNFRHLVNRRRRAMVNDVNASLGRPGIELLAPPEV